jgi:cytochrome P450
VGSGRGVLDNMQLNYPSPTGLEEPWTVFERLRRDAPVYRLPDRLNVFVVSRYDDVRRVLTDPATFTSSGSRRGPDGSDLLLGNAPASPAATPIVESDPPYHKPKRQLGFAAFKPVRIKGYEGMIRELVDALIDEFAERGECEFVEEFALPLPLRLTLQLMGVPDADLHWVRLWAEFEASGLSWMPAEFQSRQRGNGARMAAYLTETILERADDPGDDVISLIVREQVARDGAFDLDEVRAVVAILLAGGVATTAHFLPSLLLLLLQRPGELKRLRTDPAGLPQAVEEGLRLEPPTLWIPLRVARDTELGGAHVPAGSYLIVLLGAANRDETHFAAPDDFRTGRRKDHLTFGYGPHFCLGAPLARLEARIALQRLLARLPNLRLSTDNDLAHKPSPGFRALRALRIEFDPTTVARPKRIV